MTAITLGCYHFGYQRNSHLSPQSYHLAAAITLAITLAISYSYHFCAISSSSSLPSNHASLQGLSDTAGSCVDIVWDSPVAVWDALQVV